MSINDFLKIWTVFSIFCYIIFVMERLFGYILTVSELTKEIKDILEMEFPEVWVEGEVSNIRFPSSGHIYFTLKDDYSQIRAVIFRLQAKPLRFNLEDGLYVICHGRLSLYEKKGEYQLILDSIEPKGIGALQLAFLQLKEKLQREGLFDLAHKKHLPYLPQKIGLITSPVGAVIRDMIQIIHRRFENTHIILYPVKVQGEGASQEICEAIEYFNRQKEVDVIILGRGGGSIEDLAPFNEEIVARAIYNSKIPIVSAVGHETDYTISDFVADLRAPTPSAAAELVVKEKFEIKKTIKHLYERLEGVIFKILDEERSEINHLNKRLISPKKRVEEYFFRIDDLINRAKILTTWNINRKEEKLIRLKEGLMIRTPGKRIKQFRLRLSENEKRIFQNLRYIIEIKRQKLDGILGKLNSLSPISILQRGYSITRKIPSLKILTDANQVKAGERVEVKLYKGKLICGIERVEES